MEREYKCGRGDRWARYSTVLTIVLLMLGIAALFYFYGAMYLSVWVSVVAAVLVTLFVLSVPRKVMLNDDELEVRCVLESSYLPLEEVSSVEYGDLRGKICLCGSFGFFGYYGYYLDLRGFSLGHKVLVRVYGKRRHDMVDVVCGSRRYLIGCSESDELLHLLREKSNHVSD